MNKNVSLQERVEAVEKEKQALIDPLQIIDWLNNGGRAADAQFQEGSPEHALAKAIEGMFWKNFNAMRKGVKVLGRIESRRPVSDEVYREIESASDEMFEAIKRTMHVGGFSPEAPNEVRFSGRKP